MTTGRINRGNPKPRREPGAALPTARADTPFGFGTAYYPDHWPEADWARDLDRIVAAGIELVRFGEFSWSWYEPAPGSFDFGGFDRFVDLVEARDLKLCLCTPTATPPPWFDTRFPDGRLQDMHGRRCLAHRHFWSWNHPGSWEHAAATITRLVRRYAGRRCLWGWQIDNEPNYAEQIHRGAPEAMYDHNPHARRAWVAWLKHRYNGSLAALNEAWWSNFWSQRYGEWDELLLPRGRVNPHAWLDWMRWREHNLAEFVGRQRDLLRETSPGARIGCNIPETGVEFSLQIGQDYWAQAAGLDWVGTDLYRATGARAKDLARHAYSTDLLRSAAEATGAQFLVSETQAGPHERAWPNAFAGEGFGPDYLADCARVYASRGAQQIWWFLWRGTTGGHEIGMNGLQSLAGEDTPRTQVVRTMSRQRAGLVRERQRFLQRPRALVHYSRDSLRCWTGLAGDAQPLEECLAGWHLLLEAAGFRVDFIDDAGLAKLAGRDALVLPFTMVAAEPLVAAVARHEGPLLAGPQTAVLNEHGHLRAGGLPEPLVQRTGVRFGLWRDVGVMPRASAPPAVTGWRELLVQPGSKVVARLSNRQPWLVETSAPGRNGVRSQASRRGVATVSAIELGEWAGRATPPQLRRLVSHVAKALSTRG